MKQRAVFMDREGDRWFKRNREKLGKRDLVSRLIEANGIVPERVLEVGCANGWRLAKLKEKYGCEVMGVDPSMEAGMEAAELRVPVFQSTASTLPVWGQFDVVIYGFCLYMTDPEDWFRIVTEGDLALAPGGYLIVHDFDPPMEPFRRAYEHSEGLFAYHVDFARLWLAHPLYCMVSRNIGDEDDEGMVTVLKKRAISAIRTQK